MPVRKSGSSVPSVWGRNFTSRTSAFDRNHGLRFYTFLHSLLTAGIAHSIVEIDASWPNAVSDACIPEILSALASAQTDCIHGKQDQAEFAEASRMFVDPDRMHGSGRLRSSLCAFNSMHALDDAPVDKKWRRTLHFPRE